MFNEGIDRYWVAFRSIGRARTYLGMSFSILASALLAGAPAAYGDEKVIFPEQAAIIAPAEIPRLEHEAVDGSIEAAHRLATYYAMIRLDQKQVIFWQQIRVENGDRDARYDLGCALATNSDPLSRARARYWLHQVQRDGSPEIARLAIFELKSMDDEDQESKASKR